MQSHCNAVRDRRAATATWAATAASSPRELVHAPLLGSEPQKEAGAKAGGGGQARLEHLLQPLRAVLELLRIEPSVSAKVERIGKRRLQPATAGGNGGLTAPRGAGECSERGRARARLSKCTVMNPCAAIPCTAMKKQPDAKASTLKAPFAAIPAVYPPSPLSPATCTCIGTIEAHALVAAGAVVGGAVFGGDAEVGCSMLRHRKMAGAHSDCDAACAALSASPHRPA